VKITGQQILLGAEIDYFPEAPPGLALFARSYLEKVRDPLHVRIEARVERIKTIRQLVYRDRCEPGKSVEGDLGGVPGDHTLEALGFRDAEDQLLGIFRLFDVQGVVFFPDPATDQVRGDN
jgi:hypothetical protein